MTKLVACRENRKRFSSNSIISTYATQTHRIGSLPNSAEASASYFTCKLRVFVYVSNKY